MRLLLLTNNTVGFVEIFATKVVVEAHCRLIDGQTDLWSQKCAEC